MHEWPRIHEREMGDVSRSGVDKENGFSLDFQAASIYVCLWKCQVFTTRHDMHSLFDFH
jgi:hypothetical protein